MAFRLSPRARAQSAKLARLCWALGSLSIVLGYAWQARAQFNPTAPMPDAGVAPEVTPEAEPDGSAFKPSATSETSTTEQQAPPAVPSDVEHTTEIAPDVEPVCDETAQSAGAPIRYRLEGVTVRGNRTRAQVISSFVPLQQGQLFDVEDPAIEEIRWRLLGTGWFNDVKLSLQRGAHRGWVVLLIEVRERNTLLVEQLAAGLSRAVTNSMSTKDTVRPYVGLGLGEANLFGLGIGVSAAAVLTPQQYGINLSYFDPRLGKSGFSLSGRVFHNYAREFFGRNPLVSITCPVPPPEEEEPAKCDPDVFAERAVVIYHRTGFGLGTGHEISSRLRYTADWLGELVDVLSKPRSASTQRGSEVEPIDFRILDGQSIVSSLRFGLIYDDRDHPALTTRGDIAEFNARFGTHLFGSDYDFARFELTYRHWFPLPWNHVVSVGAFLGTVFGDAPFFYNFYASDLSDLLPSRVLELNLDRRRTLNLLGTSIVEMDMEDLAARLDIEYQLPLQRSGGFVRGIDAYLGAGIFLLARRDDLRVGISGYQGLARLPVDLTFDLGVQADTEIGLFKLGFSSLIGFSPLGRESP